MKESARRYRGDYLWQTLSMAMQEWPQGLPFLQCGAPPALSAVGDSDEVAVGAGVTGVVLTGAVLGALCGFVYVPSGLQVYFAEMHLAPQSCWVALHCLAGAVAAWENDSEGTRKVSSKAVITANVMFFIGCLITEKRKKTYAGASGDSNML
jgi:hypothetical protein